MSSAPRSRDRQHAEGGDDRGGIDDVLVKLYRCATVVKGGRRFSFGALVVVGDRDGKVGFGYGKANEVPAAVEKSIKLAKRKMLDVPLRGTSIPHRVIGKFGASRVVMVPASPGTGVIAGAAPRAVLELAGVRDVLTKCYGSTSPKNLVKATIDGLTRLRTRAVVEGLRGVQLDLPPDPERPPRAPRRETRAPRREGRGGGRRGGRPGEDRGAPRHSEPVEAPTQAPAVESPAPENPTP